MQSQSSFLEAQGVTDQTPKGEIQHLKTLHRQQYKRDHQKALYQRKITIRSFYTPNEHNQVKRAAAAHNMPWATFQKAATFAYMDKSFVVPDEETTHRLEMAIRRIGNNINQIARFVNAHHEARWPDIVAVNEYLDGLEQIINNALRHPPESQE